MRPCHQKLVGYDGVVSSDRGLVALLLDLRPEVEFLVSGKNQLPSWDYQVSRCMVSLLAISMIAE